MSKGQYFHNDVNDLYEGDILLTKDQYLSIVSGTPLWSAVDGGNWPNAIVPYVLTNLFSRSRRRKDKVLKAMDDFHKHTCIRFRPKTERDKYYLNIGMWFCAISWRGRDWSHSLLPPLQRQISSISRSPKDFDRDNDIFDSSRGLILIYQNTNIYLTERDFHGQGKATS